MTADEPQGEEQNAEEPSSSPEPEASGQGDEDIAKVRREAAGHRRKLREVEQERDLLRGHVSTMQRAEVERSVADKLEKPSDLWLAVELEELVDEEGAIDPAKLDAARERVLEDHPHWRKQEQAPNFDGGAREPAPPGPPNFGAALKRAAGQ